MNEFLNLPNLLNSQENESFNGLKTEEEIENQENIESENDLESEQNTNADSVENQNEVIKNYFIKTPKEIEELSLVFGKNNEELIREFSEFKAKKLYSKLDFCLLNESESTDEFVKKCLLASKFGFNSVSVLPTYTTIAKANLIGKGVEVKTVIGYPFGELTKNVRICAFKDAFKNGADCVIDVLPISAVKNRKVKLYAKTLKKILKIAGKKKVGVMLDAKRLTALEMENAVKEILSECTPYSIMPSLNFYDGILPYQIVKDLITISQGKCFVEAGGGQESPEEAVRILVSGANAFSTQNAVKIVDKLNEKICSSQY